MEKGMSVWRSPSGNLHWLRGCSGAAGRHRMVRVTVSRATWDSMTEQSTPARCRCTRTVDFTPGRQARS
jgi:hypothetical protein